MAENISRKDLVDAIAAKTAGISKKDIESILKGFMDTVTVSMKKGDKISLVGFGTFNLVQKKATEKKNPKTGATVKVPAKKVMKFKTSKALNDELN